MMRIPKILSFFNSPEISKFNFSTRYYNKNLDNKKQIKFNRPLTNPKSEKGRNKRIIFFIIILSLLAYYLLT